MLMKFLMYTIMLWVSHLNERTNKIMGLKQFIVNRIRRGFSIKVGSRSILINVKRNKKSKAEHSAFREARFRNDFRFNFFLDDNLDESVKRIIISQLFYQNVGYYPNIDSPKTFSEKVLWLKLYYDNPLIKRACDKVEMKKYVEEVLGPGHTVPLLEVYSSVFDIDLDRLPNSFVLKVNWASGFNIIVKDKQNTDIDYIRAALERWTLPWNNSYYGSFNRGYKAVKPTIFAEKYLELSDPAIEYKAFCINGKMRFCLLEIDYFGKNPKRAYYDANGEEVPFQFGNIPKVELDKLPENYRKMINMAEKLAEPFPYVRVDFYESNGKLYVGELTFYSGSGFSVLKPEEWDKVLGEELDISSYMINGG